MRTLFVVGRQTSNEIELYRICAWCQCPMSAEDAVKQSRGARPTHGICEACAARADADPSWPRGAA